jgi:hypothetical protein
VTDLIKGEDHHSKSPSVMHLNGKTTGVSPEVDKREIEEVFELCCVVRCEQGLRKRRDASIRLSLCSGTLSTAWLRGLRAAIWSQPQHRPPFVLMLPTPLRLLWQRRLVHSS